jgi:hypothetical protein
MLADVLDIMREIATIAITSDFATIAINFT